MPLVKSSSWVLWQNSRNLQYIRGENFLTSKKLADSKTKTKQFLQAQKIAVPETLQTIKSQKDITPEMIAWLTPPFVVKPNNGFGGKGILIIEDKDGSDNFITNSGEIYSPQRFREHLNYILDGFFSLSWGRDTAIIERKIVLTHEIELLGTYGLPDIRVIGYNMVPVMAMMRIPTKESGGKANIHGGAAAVGIDIGTGELTYIFHRGRQVKSLPGIGDIRGIIIPEWEKILSLAIGAQKATGIKFLWCDIVLDEEKWPLLLEINVRPGLEIQNVNRSPLKARLDKVEGVSISSVEKWVRLGRDLFSGDIDDRIEQLSGKRVAGTREYIKIFQDDKTHTYIADIRVSQTENLIDRAFAEDILKADLSQKNHLRLQTEILGEKRIVSCRVEPLDGENIILGKNILKGFLIDPFKYKKGENPLLPTTEKKERNTAIKKIHESQLLSIDAALMSIDTKLPILKYVTPTNLEEEKQKFIAAQGDYTPKFSYPPIEIDLDALEHTLRTIEISDIPLSGIYERKREEIHNKIRLLRAIKDQDTSDITLYSSKLYGTIDDEVFEKAKEILKTRDTIRPEEEFVGVDEIRDYIKKFNHIYGVKIRVKEENTTARFVMRGDTLVVRQWALVGKRELRSIIAHEIEGHYLRKINGRKSRFTILSRGGANYIETDEGIAIYNQNRFITPQDKKYYSIFERYYFIHYAQKHSYRRLIAKLAEMYDDDYERVFQYMLRLKRWLKDPTKDGIFMKDVVYANGYFWVKAYIDWWGSLQNLYIGKLHIDDIAEIGEDTFFSEHTSEVMIPFSV